jgi:deazaflavin-dependent oxidoreductase (nitroreductase family)
MTLSGDYAASPTDWVREQVDLIEATGDTRQVRHPSGWPIVLLTMVGARSGKLRKVPLMRVEHDGAYLAVASKGGAPDNPQWFHNLLAHPDIDLQDGTATVRYRARLVTSEPERSGWWRRAVEAFPPYAEYQARTEREIPLFVLEPTPHPEPA